MVTQALILAAGRGTRLGALTADCPKPLLDLGGRPILERIIVALRDGAGVREFVIVTGHLAERIETRLGDGARLGVAIRCVRQPIPDGTGRAVHLARDALHSAPFVMTYGDIVIAPGNYRAIVEDFEAHPCDLLVGLSWVEDPWAGAAVYLDEARRVTAIVEKPPRGASTTHWNSAGLMVMTPAIFTHTERLTPSPRGEHELTDAIRALLAAGGHVRGFALHGFWSDIGTPEDLRRAREALGAS